MENNTFNPGKNFIQFSLILLLIGITAGVLSSLSYIMPDFLKEQIGFIVFRPVHVSSIFFWITIAATGAIYTILYKNKMHPHSIWISQVHFVLLLFTVCGILVSYFFKRFGGREYWEFDPLWSIPIFISWILFLISYLKTTLKIKNWPVYYWMWFTGIVFFLFIFIENYLWLIPYFRDNFIKDLTIQWKVNGSIVGAYNQMIYATAFYIMDKMTSDETHKIGRKKIVFAMYFLGLTNLMFNWSHHIYTLPTDSYVKHIGYGVSMTEWILFLRTIYLWKKTVKDLMPKANYFPFKFIVASEIWVFLNLGQALLMSIPAINIYTHGTHVTVAHSMATTIGINTMILLAFIFMFYDGKDISEPNAYRKFLKNNFWFLQISLLLFIITLNIAGIKKGLWQLDKNQIPFSLMMEQLNPWFIIMSIAGLGIFFSLLIFIIYLLRKIKNKS